MAAAVAGTSLGIGYGRRQGVVAVASGGLGFSNLNLRQHLRTFTHAEPSLLRGIDHAEVGLRTAQQYRASLPETPKDLFVAAVKKCQALEHLDLADRQITERRNTVEILVAQHQQNARWPTAT